MQLIEYLRSDTCDLVDAVFADEEGRYWHFQKVGTRHTARVGGQSCIHYAMCDRPPKVGVEATDYEVLLRGRNGAWLVVDSHWHELMSTALRPGGSTAALRIFGL